MPSVQWLDTDIGDDRVSTSIGSGDLTFDHFEHVHGNEWMNQLWAIAVNEAAQRLPASFSRMNLRFRTHSLDGDSQRIQRGNRFASMTGDAFTALDRYTKGMYRSFCENDLSAMFPWPPGDPRNDSLRATPEVEHALKILDASDFVMVGHHAHLGNGVYHVLPSDLADDDNVISTLNYVAGGLLVPRSKLAEGQARVVNGNVIVAETYDAPLLNPGRSLHAYGVATGVPVQVTEYAPFLFTTRDGLDLSPGDPPIDVMQELFDIARLVRPSLASLRSGPMFERIAGNERRSLIDALEVDIRAHVSGIEPMWSRGATSKDASSDIFYSSIQIGQASRLAMLIGQPTIARTLENARRVALRCVAAGNDITFVPPQAVALGQMLSCFTCIAHELDYDLDLEVAAPYLESAARSQVRLDPLQHEADFGFEAAASLLIRP